MLQDVLPELDEVPGPQMTQSAAERKPGVIDIRPGGQSLQLDSDCNPRALEYLPALQFKHCCTLLAPKPEEKVPAAQEMQIAWPDSAWYFPLAQSVQFPPAAVPCEMVPGTHSLHVQALISATTERACHFPAWQLLQIVAPFSDVRPLGQTLHAVAFWLPTYFPTLQATHSRSDAWG